jgi:hypothetical protein
MVNGSIPAMAEPPAARPDRRRNVRRSIASRETPNVDCPPAMRSVEHWFRFLMSFIA